MTNPDGLGTRQPRHTRTDVVAAALEILDQHGLADLTMRRLAATLSVQPSALYWHFANKQSLLASLADQIVARADGPTTGLITQPTEWIRATRAQANALRDALLAIRDGAEVVSSSLALSLGAASAQRCLREAIAGGGFDPIISEIAASALLHYILGHVSHEQQRLQADSLGVVAGSVAADPAGVAATDANAPTQRAPFDFGITLLIDGLELQLTSRTNH
ncbi:MAG: TetR family transcriptional regulator [Microbacteriaceae bacterium]|nr:TetR family transcriptional regulator [Microbacteriaceae bacterium]